MRVFRMMLKVPGQPVEREKAANAKAYKHGLPVFRTRIVAASSRERNMNCGFVALFVAGEVADPAQNTLWLCGFWMMFRPHILTFTHLEFMNSYLQKRSVTENHEVNTINIIIQETNRRGREDFDSAPVSTRKKKKMKFQEITSEKMKKFTGLCVLSGKGTLEN
nr:unnamed protein product [Callosobruchus analis]